MIDLKVNPKILVSALSLSMAQRLVRVLCEACKKERTLSDSDKKTIELVLQSIKEEGKDIASYGVMAEPLPKVYEAVGCEKCNKTGYKGRLGIFEAIKTDEAIEKIMPENPSEREIKKVARMQGILSMRQDGMVKILKGITSLEEVQSVVDLLEE